MKDTKFKIGQTPWNKGIKKELDIEYIKKEYLSGKSTIFIGKKLGISSSTIAKRLKKEGIVLRKELTEEHKKQISDTLKRKGIQPKQRYSGEVWNKGKKGLQVPWNKNKVGLQKSTKKGKTFEEIYGTDKAKDIKQKLKEANLMERSPAWKGGISKEPYSFDFNEELKMLIRKRDNFKCQVCSAPAVNVHHIDYNKKNSNTNNFVTLCDSCHIKTNFNREHWTTFFHSLLSKLYGYNY